MKRCKDLNLHHQPEALLRKIRDRNEIRNRRVVDQDIDRSERLPRGFDELATVRVDREIRAHRQRFTASFVDVCDGFVNRARQVVIVGRFGASRHDNSRAFHRIAQRDRFADAPTRAGDHSHLASQDSVFVDSSQCATPPDLSKNGLDHTMFTAL